MKRIIAGLLLIGQVLLSNAGVIILEGKYKGEDIYVQNSYTSDSSSICTEKVLVNGKEILFEKISVFKIDLTAMNVKIGDSFQIRIVHRDDCKPKILTPHITTPNYFKLFSLKMHNDSLLEWNSITAEDKITYTIEQYRWNKWVYLDTLESKINPDTTFYNFNIKKYAHSGLNQFRIKITDTKNVPNYSKPIKLKTKSTTEPFLLGCGNLDIKFTEETMYEIQNERGDVVKSGIGQRITISELPKGLYYLNYDNKTTEFIKR